MNRPWQVPFGTRTRTFARREDALNYAVLRIAGVALSLPTREYHGRVRNRETGESIAITVEVSETGEVIRETYREEEPHG